MFCVAKAIQAGTGFIQVQFVLHDGITTGYEMQCCTCCIVMPQFFYCCRHYTGIRSIACTNLEALEHGGASEALGHEPSKALGLPLVHSSHIKLHQGSTIAAAGRVGSRAAAGSPCGVRGVGEQNAGGSPGGQAQQGPHTAGKGEGAYALSTHPTHRQLSPHHLTAVKDKGCRCRSHWCSRDDWNSSWGAGGGRSQGG